MSKTFLDWLVMLDCSLCICNIASLAGILMQQGTGTFCSFLAPFCFFTALLNRLLSMAVVVYRKILIIYIHIMCDKFYWLYLYRYVFVLKPSYVQTTFQRQAVSSLILGSIILISIILTGFSSFYKDDYFSFLGI